jgi:hypothetical protein
VAGARSTCPPIAITDDAAMTIHVVGHGIVGRRLERLLAPNPIRVHRPPVDRRIDVDQGDVVVLSHPVEHAPLAHVLAARGVSVVSVGDELDDTRELLALDGEFAAAGTTLVVGAAMSPGLSGLLARKIADDLHRVDEIHVALHGTAGPSCARQHHRSLSGWSLGWRDGEWQYTLAGGGRELLWFPEPVGAIDCYHASVAGPLLLHQSFPDVSRISARRSARRRDRFSARLPMLAPPHKEGATGALRVEVRGADASGARVTEVLGIAELVGLASAATAAAFVLAADAGDLPHGAVATSDAGLDTLALLGQVQRFGVRLQEFTGLAQST